MNRLLMRKKCILHRAKAHFCALTIDDSDVPLALFTFVGFNGCCIKRGRESDQRQKESPPVESQDSEQTPSRSKLSLREESRCGWINS